MFGFKNQAAAAKSEQPVYEVFGNHSSPDNGNRAEERRQYAENLRRMTEMDRQRVAKLNGQS